MALFVSLKFILNLIIINDLNAIIIGALYINAEL